MDFFVDHAVLFALVCAGVAILYGLYLTWWLLKQPAGNERMREISRAVQEGAGAYLRKQYTTIAAVAVVPFLLIGFYNDLGWGTAIGFLFGATPWLRLPERNAAERQIAQRATGATLEEIYAGQVGAPAPVR